MQELTEKQEIAYWELFNYQAEFGCPMSTRELQDALGEASQNGALNKMKQLESKGYIEKTGKGRARNYIIPSALARFLESQGYNVSK